jgi:hypothetical protein
MPQIEQDNEPPLQGKQGSVCDSTLDKPPGRHRLWHRVKRHTEWSDGQPGVGDSIWDYVGTARNSHIFPVALATRIQH